MAPPTPILRGEGVRAPDPGVTDRKRADWTLENAVPMLQRAAGGPVVGLIGGADPFSSVQSAVAGSADAYARF